MAFRFGCRRDNISRCRALQLTALGNEAAAHLPRFDGRRRDVRPVMLCRMQCGGIVTTEVWLVELDRSAEGLEMIERRSGRLSSEDFTHIAATRNPELARQRRLSSIASRLLIARCAGSGRFDRVAFRRLAGGKPVLADGGPAFSLAHGDGRAVVAVGNVEAIGVDIEPSRPLRMNGERRRLLIKAAATLTASEDLLGDVAGDAAARQAGDNDDQAVLRAWVRLEAYAKALGCGIGRILTEQGVIARSGRGGTAARDGRQAPPPLPVVKVRDLRLPADAHGRAWFGAVAVAGAGADDAIGSLCLEILPADAEAMAGLVTAA